MPARTIAGLSGLVAAWAAAAGPSAGSGDAKDYLAFSDRHASACTRHRAEMHRIENTHPERTIEVVLWRYLGDTRSQGRSVKTIAPGDEPVDLGCTKANGLQRRWRIKSAEFLP